MAQPDADAVRPAVPEPSASCAAWWARPVAGLALALRIVAALVLLPVRGYLASLLGWVQQRKDELGIGGPVVMCVAVDQVPPIP